MSDELFSFDEQLKRLKIASGTDTDSALMNVLGVKSSGVYNARGRGNIPHKWFVAISTKYGVDLDWLLTGKGQMRRSQLEQSAAQVPPETTGMLAGMHGKLATLEQEIAQNRATLNQGMSQPCSMCLELYAKLEKANERLYEAMRENGELKAEIGKLREELVSLKNEPSPTGGQSSMASAS